MAGSRQTPRTPYPGGTISRPESRAAEAAAALRNRILSGQVRPGTALREEHLSAELLVSRNTLREAFKLLRAEGLVEHLANRGTRVRALTASDVDDILTTRRVLEPEAAARLARHAATAAPLEDLARQIGLAARRRDVRGYFLADRNFHAELTWLAFGSRRLRLTIQRCMNELTVAFAYFDRQALQVGNAPDPEREHADLLVPIVAGDRAASRRRMEEHLDHAATALRGTTLLSSRAGVRADEP